MEQCQLLAVKWLSPGTCFALHAVAKAHGCTALRIASARYAARLPEALQADCAGASNVLCTVDASADLGSIVDEFLREAGRCRALEAIPVPLDLKVASSQAAPWILGPNHAPDDEGETPS